MTVSGSSERLQEFSPAQYIAPYLLLVVGYAGARNASWGERPVVFCVFAVAAALGVVLAVTRLRCMWNIHQRQTVPAWTRFLGLLLALYGLYVVYSVSDGLT